ncbi:MAG: IS66 family insertion sequence element accessory protein TnpB [Proteobacteria bacterium]|nr:IS66 family insertion sequence element accessory protein TnpB [Pseudomonadota bacterium]
MMRPGPEVAVYLCAAPVDMRRQANGLALLVEQGLQRDVFAPALYCFTNRRRDRVKIVYWERNGLCLWSKRLEGRDRFIWPSESLGETVSMTGRELNALLDGFDVVRRGHRDLDLRRVG